MKTDAGSILITIMAAAILFLVLLSWAFCGSVFAEIPRREVARDSVDLIERNHYYDDCGRLVFEQIIFWDWSANFATYCVRAWRLLKHPSQIPQRDQGGYVTIWSDGELLRVVRSKQVKETWLQFDPELHDREFHPKEQRAELQPVTVRKRWTQDQAEIDRFHKFWVLP